MKYVAYYRISKKEDRPSLGLDAQRNTVLDYIRHNGNQLIAEFTETESGKNDNRPELLKAIHLSKKEQATLVIAKLDRLSRNVTFISTLMDNKVKFVCCDMPEATALTIHIFSALAQWERKRISERTREALQAKMRTGWKAGRAGKDNLNAEARIKGREAVHNKARSNKKTRHAYHFIKPLRESGMTYYNIAKKLNEEGYTTIRGKEFNGIQVQKIYERFSKEENQWNPELIHI